jgi:hypothetical protein
MPFSQSRVPISGKRCAAYKQIRKYHPKNRCVQPPAARIWTSLNGSGLLPLMPVATGSGASAVNGSSRREVRDRSMSRHTRATTVVSQPPRLSMPVVSARLSRSQAFLNGVVHLAYRAEHAVRHRAQVGSVLFEPLSQ